MTSAEESSIDSKVEQMMDWANTRKAEAEQLALDSARLMACTTDRLDRLSKQGFFKRCWTRFNGEAGAMERANVNDVIQMQKTAFRYVNMLQEQQLLMAHSLLSLKNNLNSLAIKEEETRNLIGMLAQRTLERFEELENRVGKLETSSALHDWLFTLEERDYEEKIPTDYMRLLRVINDFYGIKNDNWNNNDLMFMRKAIRTVGLNPKAKLSIAGFIEKLTDEIQSDKVGFDKYDAALTMFAPEGIDNFSTYAVENISSPVFATIHGLKSQFMDKMDAVEALQDSLSISTSDALKVLLKQSIKNMNVNLDYEFPLAETAIEVLGCMRLADKISGANADFQQAESEVEDNETIHVNPTQNKSCKKEIIILRDANEVLDFGVDMASRVAYGTAEIDREKTLLTNPESGSEVYGTLPQDFSELIKIVGVSIPAYQIAMWIDTGNEFGCFSMADEVPGYMLLGERKENKYGILDIKDLMSDDTLQNKFIKIMDKMAPRLQEKIERTFPETKS